MGMSLILGSSMMVAGPVIAGCSTGVSADEWATTEGAIGAHRPLRGGVTDSNREEVRGRTDVSVGRLGVWW